ERIDSAHPPIRSELFNSADDRSGSPLGGAVTSFLPVNLEEAVLLHRGKSYPLGNLLPGEANRKRVTPSTEGALSWAKPGASYSAISNRGYRGSPPTNADPEPARLFMRSLMFHEASQSGEQKRVLSNGSLRIFDQSWRI